VIAALGTNAWPAKTGVAASATGVTRAGRSVEAGTSCDASAQPLGQRALRGELTSIHPLSTVATNSRFSPSGSEDLRTWGSRRSFSPRPSPYGAHVVGPADQVCVAPCRAYVSIRRKGSGTDRKPQRRSFMPSARHSRQRRAGTRRNFVLTIQWSATSGQGAVT